MDAFKRKPLFNKDTGKCEVDFKVPGKEAYDSPKLDLDKIQDEPKFPTTKYINDLPPIDNRTRSEKIIEWFGSHELVSKNGVCELAGIDTSNFNKLLKFGKEIPDKILDKIEPIIKKYGYVS